ncbi:MAG: HlyD family type I secretion periplasmic adaptor subunit [marine bacterium B5-7]|nr:MAG: HlyD family type I secretion periplasmic adaptor subunit [marine bacterium B5-7]
MGEPSEEDGEGSLRVDDVKRGTHLFLALLVALCVCFLLWAVFGQLDIASLAQGEVVPSSKIKHVQHLEGGIVKKILVKDGEKVTMGQPLVVLESTASGADVHQIQVQLASLKLNQARLNAELNGLDTPNFPLDLVKQHPRSAEQAKKHFDFRMKNIKNKKTSQHEQVEQREAELEEIKARLNNLKKALVLSKEQVTISEELLKEDLTNRYNHIDLLRESNALESRIQEDTAVLKKAESTLSEEKSDLSGIDNTFKEDVTKSLTETRQKINELTQQLAKYSDNLQRTTIISPVEGVVKELFVSSRGQVVKAGETVLDIIPSGDQLVIEARLPVQDVGYIEVGQKAIIRLASGDATRFNHLEGEVVFISPDTITQPEQDPYYRVRVVTESDHFKGRGLKYQLYPGIQVSVSIITGSRSIMAYLLDPFIGAMRTALNER